MLKGYDYQDYEKVVMLAEEMRIMSGCTSEPTDIKAIADFYKFPYNLNLRAFSNAIELFKKAYIDKYSTPVRDEYLPIGVRYLFMPESNFNKNAYQYDFDLFELKKIYRDVEYTSIAYHMPEVMVSTVKKVELELTGRFSFSHFRVNENAPYNPDKLILADELRIAQKVLCGAQKKVEMNRGRKNDSRLLAFKVDLNRAIVLHVSWLS